MSSYLYFSSATTPNPIIGPGGIKKCEVITASSLITEQLSYDQLVVTATNVGAMSRFLTSDDYYISSDDGDVIWGIADKGDFQDIVYGTPVWLYDNDVLLGKYYITTVRRISKTLYEITAVSPIGLMETMTHYGGLYTGQTFTQVLTDIIGASTTGKYNERVVDADVANTRIYGYLPVATQRNNLHQLLLSTGVNCKRDASGVMYFTFPNVKNSIAVPDSEVYLGGSIQYVDPSTAIEVTEHNYKTSDSEEKLFENIGGEAALHTTVTFSTPHHTLRGEGITIESSGVNYAMISGTGTLYGKKYDHITSTITKILTTSNAVDKVTKISDCTLINYLNSEFVADRAAAYYTSASKITADIVQNGRLAGDIISFTDPFGEIASGFIAEMATSITSVFHARCQIIAGYMPSGGGNSYQHVAYLGNNITWVKPAGVTKIRIVVIGAGERGENGAAGNNGNWGDGWNDYTKDYNKRTLEGGAPGKGGKGGAGGQGGKIFQRSIEVPAAAASYSTVAGNPLNNKESSITINGTTYSSAQGARTAFGFTDLLNNSTMARPGEAGIDGGDGMWGVSTGSSSRYPVTSVYNKHTYTTHWQGAGCLWANSEVTYEDSNDREQTMYARVGGGGGGGASGYQDGSVAYSGEVVYHSISYIHLRLSQAGDGAWGGYTRHQSVYGAGGLGGNGGGGGGGAGGYWIEAVNGRSQDWYIEHPSTAGQGGAGGEGGDGGDGIILVYY